MILNVKCIKLKTILNPIKNVITVGTSVGTNAEKSHDMDINTLEFEDKNLSI